MFTVKGKRENPAAVVLRPYLNQRSDAMDYTVGPTGRMGLQDTVLS